MAERLIRNADDLDLWITFLGGRKLPITVSCIEGLDRSTAQNNLMWKWASEVEQQTQQETAEEVQRRWKLDHGVPILCGDDPAYRQFCRAALGPLNYEQRKKAMKFIPVTSEMKVKQMVRFMDAVERECLEQGIVLTQPEPDLAAYNNRYRQKEAA